MIETDIILSTLGACQSYPLSDYPHLPFRCVIVDESAQCCEPELLLPLWHNVNHKMILIGDPKQLPATVICRKAEKMLFGRSLFQRFVTHFASLKNETIATNLVMLLNTQFRMKTPLIQWPSIRFYDGQLTTQFNSGINPFIQLQPILVFDIQDTTEQNQNMSKMNELEAKFINKLLLAIITQSGYPEFADPVRRYSLMYVFFKFDCFILKINFFQEQKRARNF